MNFIYSILIFVPELNQQILDQVKTHLKLGKKVFLLSYIEPDAYISKDIFLEQASKKFLLNCYIVKENGKLAENNIILYDGQGFDNEILDFFDENSLFNKEQYILEHQTDSHHSLVKAGAGTGKTTTMINRVSFLKHYHSSVLLKDLVMITFTNEAAINMREKLMQKWKDYYDLTKDNKYLLWLEEINDMFIGTIHSFAKEFLVKEGTQFGFSPLLEIRSYRHRQRKLVEKYIDMFAKKQKEIYQSFRYIPHYKLIQTFMMMMERIHNKAISYKEVLNIEYGVDQKNFHVFVKFVIQNVEAELLQLKQREATLEIHDLISRLHNLRFISPGKLSMSIKYLFVDEFQDTDESQVSFTSWLVDKYKCLLFAVGDIKQSIYRFRGADYTAFNQVANHLDLTSQKYKAYSIQKNYRSSEKLISQFNSLFKKWDKAVKQFQFEDTDELQAVVNNKDSEGLVTISLGDVELKNILNRFYGKDLVFLVRSNKEVLEMVKRVEKLGFFCEADIKGSFYRTTAVREFYLLIRRITHPNISKDRYAFNLSSYSETRLPINVILNNFDGEKLVVLDLLNKIEVKNNWDDINSNSVITLLEKLIERFNPADCFRRRFYQDKMMQYPEQKVGLIKDEAIFQYKEYKANLEHLFFILKKEFSSDVTASIFDIEKFLAIKMATDTTENEWKAVNKDHKRFKVMTVHKSKGQEYDVIILPFTEMAFLRNNYSDTLLVKKLNRWNYGYKVHWGETSFQNDQYSSNIEDENNETIAEETRLLYVALTRAKKTLFVNSSNLMNTYKIDSWNDLIESGEMLRV